jgi:hypothetical protein
MRYLINTGKEDGMKRSILPMLLASAMAFTMACNRADHKAEEHIEDKMKNANLERVDVKVKNGVVTLEGEVNNDMQRSQAEVIAKETPGVNDVKDNLRVVYEDTPGDEGMLTPTPTDNQPPTGGGKYMKGDYPPPGTTGDRPVDIDATGGNAGTEMKDGKTTEGTGTPDYNNPVIKGAGSPSSETGSPDKQQTDKKENSSGFGPGSNTQGGYDYGSHQDRNKGKEPVKQQKRSQ